MEEKSVFLGVIMRLCFLLGIVHTLKMSVGIFDHVRRTYLNWRFGSRLQEEDMEDRGGSGDDAERRKQEFVPRENQHEFAEPDRLEAIRSAFRKLFSGQPPDFLLRVPGRVNIIGEHIDYCGYAVFPMAIEHDVIVAGRTVRNQSEETVSTIHIANTDTNYPEYTCSVSEIKSALEGRDAGTPPGWHLYFFCGLRGVMEEYNLDIKEYSIEILVDGRVPARAGLSSSSALVCAATLASLCANNINLSKRDIADLSAKSERFIGTQGGGMDQAIAMLATSGCAQFIEFVPTLRAQSVSLPSGAIFVVANSLAEANKAANDSYNYRVTECRLATWILAKKKGLDVESIWKPFDLQLQLKITLDQLLVLVDKELHEEPYTVPELTRILGVEEDKIRERSAIKDSFNSSLTFKLRQRIQHVYSEAARVELFREICNEAGETAHVLQKLGKLMNLSHQSLKELYECSHSQLDTLVHLAQNFSHGARLTGAGWGGCMVALVDESKLANFLSVLEKKYYEDILGISGIQSHVFVTSPSRGATILESKPLAI